MKWGRMVPLSVWTEALFTFISQFLNRLENKIKTVWLLGSGRKGV